MRGKTGFRIEGIKVDLFLPLMAVALMMFIIAMGCNKQVHAPVPGTINSFDAWAARIIGDSRAAIVETKGWELCSDQKFPAQVEFDGHTVKCDSASGPFPAAGRSFLYNAENYYNAALEAARAYHSGATNDPAATTTAVNKLGTAVGQMLAGVGKGH